MAKTIPVWLQAYADQYHAQVTDVQQPMYSYVIFNQLNPEGTAEKSGRATWDEIERLTWQLKDSPCCIDYWPAPSEASLDEQIERYELAYPHLF